MPEWLDVTFSVTHSELQHAGMGEGRWNRKKDFCPQETEEVAVQLPRPGAQAPVCQPFPAPYTRGEWAMLQWAAPEGDSERDAAGKPVCTYVP